MKMIGVVILILAVFSTKTQAEVIGTITALPPADLTDLCIWPLVDKVTSCLVSKNNDLHTWSKWARGTNLFKMKLDWSVLGGDNYIVTLFYNSLILDKAQANRFDGELTQSVTAESKGNNKQVVTWLMSDKTCIQRTYYTSNLNEEWILEKKEEVNCKFPSSTFSLANLSKQFVNRKNYWFWGEMSFSSWGKNNGISSGFWGGSVVKLPSECGMSSTFCQQRNLLHTWDHSMAKNYKLLLYKNLDGENKVRFYIEIRYDNMILDSGIEVSRFDDDMLTSVTIMEDQTLRDNRPIIQTDNFQVAYKMTNGECNMRVYKMEHNEKGERLDKVTFGWETPCKFLYQQQVFYKSKLLSTENQNGWNY